MVPSRIPCRMVATGASSSCTSTPTSANMSCASSAMGRRAWSPVMVVMVKGKALAILCADAVAAGSPACAVEESHGLLRVEVVLLEAGVVIGAGGREVGVGDLCGPVPELVDDALAVEGVHQGLAHLFIGQLRDAVIEREVLDRVGERTEVDVARVGLEEDAVFDEERPDGGVGLAGLEGNHAHGRFWHNVFAQHVDIGPAAEVIVKGFQFGKLCRSPFTQLVRAGSDRRGAVGLLSHFGVIGRMDDGDGGPRGQRSGVDGVHIDLDGVFVWRFDRADAGEAADDGGAVVGVAVVIVSVGDIFGGQFRAVVEEYAFVQMEGVGEAVGCDVDGLGQYQFLLVELVNCYERILDVDDHHPVDCGAHESRAEAGDFLVAHPGHCAALLGAAHFGGRGFFSRCCGGGFAGVGGGGRGCAGYQEGSRAAEGGITQKIAPGQ